MTDSNGHPRVPAPTRARLAAARAAQKVQQEAGDYVCGCFAALCRDPFSQPLVEHWQRYHPNSLAILEEAQAHRSSLELRP